MDSQAGASPGCCRARLPPGREALRPVHGFRVVPSQATPPLRWDHGRRRTGDANPLCLVVGQLPRPIEHPLAERLVIGWTRGECSEFLDERGKAWHTHQSRG